MESRPREREERKRIERDVVFFYGVKSIVVEVRQKVL